MIHDKAFGRVDVRTIPLPAYMEDVNGTYTHSGKVLVAYSTADDRDTRDWYNLAVLSDDGTALRPVFSGVIPQLKGANGVRWMCFADNRRIALGDYIMECTPDIDRCDQAELIPLVYPDEILRAEDVFCHWSEIIVAPDNTHICWTTLTTDGATNYLGRMAREAERYVLEDISIVSNSQGYTADPAEDGFAIPQPTRGGEVKQFIRGGKALAMVGHGESITESVVQALDSEEIIQITDTPGYEETTIFSPDETLGIAMSPRFSHRTNCAIFGLVPQPHSMPVRGKIINVLYMYAVAGVRAFRKGNIGPALIDIRESREKGRAYQGVDLSDPEEKWVYCSPMSWHPDSTRAMWNERTRIADGPVRHRLRLCQLLDREPSAPVPAYMTPDSSGIPYAVALGSAARREQPGSFPIKVRGKAGGCVVNNRRAGDTPTYTATYDNFSDDGKTVYNGYIAVTAPESIFAMGKTCFEADLTVSGEHSGEMRLRAVFTRDGVHAPAMLSFEPGADGRPESHGWATYDGITVDIREMEP